VNNEFSSPAPYRILGLQLRKIREKYSESVADVSSAIEIDESKLDLIEQGKMRPSEDILLLLITHFSMQDDEALKVWGLAGYDQQEVDSKNLDDIFAGRQLVMVMAPDSRIIFSDNVQVVANTNGVVLNFLQAPNGPYQSQTASRIGMSRDQAFKVVELMNEALKQSEKFIVPKQLPQANTSLKRNSKKNEK
jgi:DNA-binding XRE family transcriptional regulator